MRPVEPGRGSAAIGELRRRIVLWLPQETADGFGGVRTTYAAGPALWASVTPLRAAAPSDPAVPGQSVIHRIEIRWRDRIGTGHRVGLGARRLAVRAAFDPDERRRRLVLLCEEIRP